MTTERRDDQEGSLPGPNHRSENANVKRHRLRNALRQARETAGLTQKEAAKKTYWSQSKLVRIETGVVPVSPSDVRAILHTYGVTDEELVDHLVQLADEARSEKLWDRFRDVHSGPALELFSMEESASSSFSFEPFLVPGLLQTEDYIRALVGMLGKSEKTIAKIVEGRLIRQKIMDGSRGQEFHYVIGEAALSLTVGDGDIMVSQIRHLQAMRRNPTVSISALPFSAGPYRALSNPFLVLQFNDPQLPDLLHQETSADESTTRADELTSDYLNQFIQMHDASLTGQDFDDFVDHLIDVHHRTA